jgi:hypothetical protein
VRRAFASAGTSVEAVHSGECLTSARRARVAVCFFCVTALVSAADLAIDHVTVAGADLKKMQDALASVGLRSEYGGPHSNRATEMALTSFPDGSYLELIALQKDGDPQAIAAHYWSSLIKGNAGPAAWAVRAANLAGEVERLKAAGVTVTMPSRSGRSRPDGVKLDWETSNIGSEPNGTFFPFLIRDFTPRERRAFPGGQPTARDYAGISRVVIAVRDLAAAAARYRHAYDLPEPRRKRDASFGATLMIFPGTPVVLASPSDAKSWIAERLRQFGEGPCAFILRSNGSASTRPSGRISHWFDGDVSWVDLQRLGWHLGVER